MTVENVLLLCGIGDIMTGLVFVMIVIDSILTTEVYMVCANIWAMYRSVSIGPTYLWKN